MQDLGQATKRVWKRGRDLRVGDVLRTWGEPHWRTITGFLAHQAVEVGGRRWTGRVALSGPRWGMTVFDDEHYEIAAPEAPAQRGEGR